VNEGSTDHPRVRAGRAYIKRYGRAGEDRCAAGRCVAWRRGIGRSQRRVAARCPLRDGHTLAVYGTLARAGPNHHVLAPLGASGRIGTIEGTLIPLGWGAGPQLPQVSAPGPGEIPWR
jgi:hypothetical protein